VTRTDKQRRKQDVGKLDTHSEHDQVLDFKMLDGVGYCRLGSDVLEATRILVGNYDRGPRSTRSSLEGKRKGRRGCTVSVDEVGARCLACDDFDRNSGVGADQSVGLEKRQRRDGELKI
jgi:hypothetical protein